MPFWFRMRKIRQVKEVPRGTTHNRYRLKYTAASVILIVSAPLTLVTLWHRSPVGLQYDEA